MALVIKMKLVNIQFYDTKNILIYEYRIILFYMTGIIDGDVICVFVQSDSTYKVLSFFIPSNKPMESSIAHEISLFRISL